ncbi:hypothetical protein [Nonomuraea angiospora]
MGSRLPFLDVTCPTAGCRAEGVVRRIHLPMIIPGVVEQPTYRCVPCGAVMLPVDAWPALAGTEENMPKITAHGGPSNAAAEREHQLDAPSEGVEVPADGTESPEITGDGTGEALPPAEGEEEPAPEPKKLAKRSSRARKAKPDEGAAELTITAEAEVTSGDAS